MNNEIKSLKPTKEQAPSIWSMFTDATGGISYTRVVGFLVVIVFFTVWAYLCFTTGTMIPPPKEMVYVLIAFAAAKPVQRFAETKEVDAQLNYDFQMAQIETAISGSGA